MATPPSHWQASQPQSRATLAALATMLRHELGADSVIDDPAARGAYALDASMIDGALPDLVVLPRTPAQVVRVMQLAAQAGVPVVARGAGTGISGGAIPLYGGIALSLARMERVERIDPRNRLALVETGVVNLELSQRLAPYGYQFAPDPSSQRASTIGGNIGENAGGPHCLKYGVTTNHILGLELVLHNGQVLWTGDGVAEAAGYDLTGLVVGSEGTFGVVTRALVRLTRLPEQNRVVLALFAQMVDAGAAVSQIIAAGHLPTSLEMMDVYAIRAVNQAYGLGLPAEAGAALIVEVDGLAEGLDTVLDQVVTICRDHGAFDVRPARTAEEQTRVWTARKSVAGAIGRLAPAYYLVDTVVPRTRLPAMLREVERLGREYELAVLNVFHAGDGNLHPLVLYHPNVPGEQQRAVALAETVMKLSIEQGGVISGEHGIGAEKHHYMPLLFSPAELETMAAVYQVFNPDGRMNPGKIFPPDLPPSQLAARRAARLTSATRRATPLPTGVVYPATITEASQLIQHCHQAGQPFRIWSHPEPATPPPELLLNLTKIAGIEVYEPDDLTITVQAGTTLATLQQELARHGQMLPLDLPDPAETTLGQAIARAADGPRRLGYGALRDLLLGVQVIERDGTLVRFGGRVVKNVSGYDLVKLYLGSRGSLGVIVAASLKVFPRQPAEATLLLACDHHTQLESLLQQLNASQLLPSAAEVWPGAAGYQLALWFEGPAPVLSAQLRLGQALADGLGLVSQVVQAQAHQALWHQLIQTTSLKVAGDQAVFRLSVLPAELTQAIQQLEQQVQAYGLAGQWVARALSGVIYLRTAGTPTQLAALQQAFTDRWRHSHILASDPQIWELAPRWGAPRPTAQLEAALRAALWGTPINL